MDVESSDEKAKNDSHKKDISLSFVLMSIRKSCVPSVIDTKGSALFWCNLKIDSKMLSQVSIDNLFELYQDICTSVDNSRLEYMNQLAGIDSGLRRIRICPTKEKHFRAMLRQLTKQFDVVVGLTKAPNNTFNDAVSTIISREPQLYLSQSRESCKKTASAFLAKGRTHLSGTRCVLCTEKGHMKCFCPDNSTRSSKCCWMFP